MMPFGNGLLSVFAGVNPPFSDVTIAVVATVIGELAPKTPFRDSCMMPYPARTTIPRPACHAAPRRGSSSV